MGPLMIVPKYPQLIAQSEVATMQQGYIAVFFMVRMYSGALSLVQTKVTHPLRIRLRHIYFYRWRVHRRLGSDDTGGLRSTAPPNLAANARLEAEGEKTQQTVPSRQKVPLSKRERPGLMRHMRSIARKG